VGEPKSGEARRKKGKKNATPTVTTKRGTNKVRFGGSSKEGNPLMQPEKREYVPEERQNPQKEGGREDTEKDEGD